MPKESWWEVGREPVLENSRAQKSPIDKVELSMGLS